MFFTKSGKNTVTFFTRSVDYLCVALCVLSLSLTNIFIFLKDSRSLPTGGRFSAQFLILYSVRKTVTRTRECFFFCRDPFILEQDSVSLIADVANIKFNAQNPVSLIS